MPQAEHTFTHESQENEYSKPSIYKKGDKPFKHGGVYAGLYDFGNGPEPAVYSYNTKRDVGNLRPLTDVDWVYYGWHMGVVLD